MTAPTDLLQATFDAGVAHHQAGRLEEAERAYDEVLAADPDHAGALNLLGMVRHQTGDLDRAIELIGRAVARQPDYAQAHNNLGNALKDQGRIDDAIAAYHRALDIVPDYALAHNNLAVALAAQGKHEEAVASYQKAIDIVPDYAMAHYNLGNTRRDQGRADDAIACYERAIEIAPALAQAHHNLGVLAAGQDRADTAAAHYRRALDVAPDFAEAHYNLATLHRIQGKTDDAITGYRRAAEIDPNNATMSFALSATLGRAGKPVDARRVLETTFRRNPVLTFRCTNPDGSHATILNLIGMQSTYLKFEDKEPSFTGGMLDTTILIDREKFTVHNYFIMENNLLGGTSHLPPFDIILNGIVEPDLEPASLDVVEAFIARQSSPYINDPIHVRLTTRDGIYALLTGIENLVVPKVARVRLPNADSSHFMPAVERHGLRFPLIVRPVGEHVGAGTVKVDHEKDFARICSFPADRAFYMIEFHDFRNKDGYFTKNRVYLIDGDVVPGHMYNFNDWNIHAHASREFMKAHEWMKKLDEGFLDNYAEYIDDSNCAALNEVYERVGLDFFGLDFTLLSDGRMLLFECNPAMGYRPDVASRDDYSYKKKFAGEGVGRFSDMVMARICGTRGIN